VTVVTNLVNRGYGAALKTGFENASGEIIGFLDADGTCDPGFFKELLQALVRQKRDIMMGSRLHPEAACRPCAMRAIGVPDLGQRFRRAAGQRRASECGSCGARR